MEARVLLVMPGISPRKVSIAMDLIRNKLLDEALASCSTPRRQPELLLKLTEMRLQPMRENNFNMDKNNLRRRVLAAVCPGLDAEAHDARAQGRGYRAS